MSGGWDGRILFWDLRTFENVGSIYGPVLSGDTLDMHD